MKPHDRTDPPPSTPATTTTTVACLGCELGCEVVVTLAGGAVIQVAGNNCPTGAIFARAQCGGEVGTPRPAGRGRRSL